MCNLPNFIVIGVAKAGTTALYQHLKAHPGIYMSPKKEPNFFSFEGAWPEPTWKKRAWVTTWEGYQALFDDVADEQAIGEASPRYFHSPVAAGRIKAILPEARIVALLRHPVDRAFSHFLHMVNSGKVDYRPFGPLFREKIPTIKTWDWEPLACYGLKHSFYYDSLRRYFDCFPRDCIKVYLFEEYRHDPRAVLSDLYAFLGVDAGFVPDLQARHNPTRGAPKSQALHNVVMRPNLLKSVAQKIIPTPLRKKAGARILHSVHTRKPTLSEEERREFIAIYRDDIMKVQDLIGRDLSLWLP